MQTQPRQGHVFEWALLADGQIVQLFQSQLEATRAWRGLKKKQTRVTQFTVEQVKGLFDG